MQNSIRTKWVFTGLALVYLFCFIGLNSNIDPLKGGKAIIFSDGMGHYDYLPRLFFKGELHYTAADHLFTSEDPDGDYINRFYCGTAVMELPFFLGGTAWAWMAGYPLDGYSPPFQYAIGLAAVVYTLWGFYFLFRLLTRFLQVEESKALWTIVFAALGTPIIFYSTWFGSFSHAFSFFAITFFIYRSCCTIAYTSTRNVLIVALLFGLIVITRPVNALVLLLVPACFPGKNVFIGFCRSFFSFKNVLLLLAGVAVPLLLQCSIWYLQTGDWVHWSYRQEGFYFLHPHIGDVLFGFRRGLFIYCPLLLLALAGTIAGFKKHRWTTGWLLVFLCAFTYVTASWWHWTYGDTFWIRPFNDVLPVFMVLFAFALTYFVRAKKVFLSAAVLCTVLNLVFAWQFAAGITNFSTMTSDKFFSLFFKTSKAYEQVYGGSDDLPPYAPHGFKTLHSWSQHFDEAPGGVLQVKGEEFVGSTEFVFPLEERYTRHIWVELSYKRKLERPDGMKDVLFVFHALDTHRDSTRSYEAIRVKEYPYESTGEWETVRLRCWFPDQVNAQNLVKAYLWNRGKENFLLDDYTISIQVPRW